MAAGVARWPSRPEHVVHEQVEQLDADERGDQAAEAVDQQVAPQQRAWRRPAGSGRPRSASGTSSGMTSALKTIAEMIADCAACPGS